MLPSERERYAVPLFFILSFAISGAAVLLLHVLALQAGLADFSELMEMAETTFELDSIAAELILPAPIVYLLSRVVDFGPTLAGISAALFVGGTAELKKLLAKLLQWRIPLRWYAWAVLIPAAISITALLFHLALGNSQITGPNWDGLETAGWLLFWIFIARGLLGGGLGEEVGWRGFALPRLQARHGALRASLLIGVVWALWHYPAALVASDPLFNMVVLFLFIVPAAFTYTWLYNGSKGSLIPVILMHAATNGTSAFFERNLFPLLLDEDAWLMFYILLTMLVGLFMAFLVRRRQQAGQVVLQ